MRGTREIMVDLDDMNEGGDDETAITKRITQGMRRGYSPELYGKPPPPTINSARRKIQKFKLYGNIGAEAQYTTTQDRNALQHPITGTTSDPRGCFTQRNHKRKCISGVTINEEIHKRAKCMDDANIIYYNTITTLPTQTANIREDSTKTTLHDRILDAYGVSCVNEMTHAHAHYIEEDYSRQAQSKADEIEERQLAELRAQAREEAAKIRALGSKRRADQILMNSFREYGDREGIKPIISKDKAPNLKLIDETPSITLIIHKEKKMPTFDGKPASIEPYLAGIEQRIREEVKAGLAIPDAVTRVFNKVGSDNLKESAITWWNNLGDQPTTLEAFKKAIRGRFSTTIPVLNVGEKVAEVKRTEGENVEAYAERMRQTALSGSLSNIDTIIPTFIKNLGSEDLVRSVSRWYSKKVQVPGGTSISWQMVVNKANEEAAITYTTTTKPTPTKTLAAMDERHGERENEKEERMTVAPLIRIDPLEIQKMIEVRIEKGLMQKLAQWPQQQLPPIQPPTPAVPTQQLQVPQQQHIPFTFMPPPYMQGTAQPHQQQQQQQQYQDKFCKIHGRTGHNDEECRQQGHGPMHGGYKGGGRGRGARYPSTQRYFQNDGVYREPKCWSCEGPHKQFDCPFKDAVRSQLTEYRIAQERAQNSSNTSNSNYSVSFLPNFSKSTTKSTAQELKSKDNLKKSHVEPQKKRRRRGCRREKNKQDEGTPNSESIESTITPVITSEEGLKETNTLIMDPPTLPPKKRIRWKEEVEVIPICEDNTITTQEVKEEKYTAVYTVLEVADKKTRTMGDTGANVSCIAVSWVEYLGCSNLIQQKKTEVIDAQKNLMTLLGTINLPVKFGKKLFNWEFIVCETLVCPLILGTDILHNGSIDLKNRRIHIAGEEMPITLTLKERGQSSVISTMNMVVPPLTTITLKGRLIHNELQPKTEDLYLIRAGGIVVDSLLVERDMKQHPKKKEIIENVEILVCNDTVRKRHIRKGDFIATAEPIDLQQYEFGRESIYNDVTTKVPGGSVLSMICSIEDSASYTEQAPVTYVRKRVATLSTAHSINTINNVTAWGHVCDSRTSVAGATGEPGNRGNCSLWTTVDSSQIDASCTKESESIKVTTAGVSRHVKVNDGCNTLFEVLEVSDTAKEGKATPETKGQPVHACNKWKLPQSSQLHRSAVVGPSSPGMNPKAQVVTVSKEQGLKAAYTQPMKQPCHSMEDKECRGFLNPKGSTVISTLSEERIDNEFMIPQEERELKDQATGVPETTIDKLIKEAVANELEKAQLKELLTTYNDRFVSGLTVQYEAGSSFFIPHEIKLNTDAPIWTRQFKLSHKEQELVEKMAAVQEESGVIEETTSTEYNSPVMCVPKKDSTWRPVIDFRNINKQTVRENWPIPRTEEALDALSKAKYMSVIDCTSGYWQIPLHHNSRKYTSFSTRYKRYQYNTLPMGITNAAPTFQKNMELMLSGMLWICCIVYIDDIIVYSNSFEEHLKHLEEVFKRLRRCNMVIKPEKCHLVRQQVQYLGHIVGNGIVTPTDENIKKIKEMRVPETLEEVRKFTMMANFYRRFIPKFAHIAKPLIDLMKRKGKKKRDRTWRIRNCSS